MEERKIIHIDMDAFFAAVEQRDNQELRGKPVAVGFDGPRGVVSTASYEARKWGVHSAQSIAQAKQRCPDLIIVPCRHSYYAEISHQIHQIFQEYTDLIEPISIDEAFLDVTENLQQIPSATEVAIRIREDIFQATGLTASAGVAPNKFLAKIASDWHKPNGICVIKPSQVQGFIQDLPLKKIPGVGKVTQEKLKSLNLNTLGDLQQIDEALLIQHFGKYGRRLFLYAQGIDERPVEVERERQQISKETTFDDDLHLNQCRPYWEPLLGQVWQSLQKKQLSARGVTVKLKLKNFQVMQHSKSFKQVLRSPQELAQALDLLLDDLHIAPQMQFRLIGVGVYQLSVLETETQLLLL